MGKTTLAQRYVDNHPMTLNLDIDNIWIMMGQWQQSRPYSEIQKLKYAYVIAAMHLADGYDVIVPNLMQSLEQYKKFEQVAKLHRATLKEIVLLSNPQDAIKRCKTRARKMGYSDGFRPGGVLDTGGRETLLERMYENVLETIAQRKKVIRITSVEGRPDDTYEKLLNAINNK